MSRGRVVSKPKNDIVSGQLRAVGFSTKEEREWAEERIFGCGALRL